MRRALMLCLLAAAAHGETATGVKWLMNEPATLWDLGLLRVESRIQGLLQARGDTNWGASVFYDQDSGRLTIEASHGVTRTSPPLTESQARNECRATIDGMRLQLMVDPSTGRPLRGEHSQLGAYFAHKGPSRQSDDGSVRPSETPGQLDAMARLRVTVYGPGVSVECEAPLLGTDIIFREQGDR